MSSKDRRARNRANLREEILDTARTMFVKQGYDNVSIRKIADKIEYAPGTIYLYFKDKAEILESLCQESFGKLHARLHAIAEDSAPPLEKLRRVGHTYVNFALENPAQYMLTFMTNSSASMRISDETHQTGLKCFEELCRVVQQCIDHNLLRNTDVHAVSQATWSAVHGVASLLIVKSGFPFIESSRLIDTVLDMVTEGLRKPSS